VLREGLPDTVSNCHKNLTDSNRAGQFYSREKWPKAPVLRWIGDNRPGQRRSRGEEEGKAEEKKGTQGRKGARTQREGGREEGKAENQKRGRQNRRRGRQEEEKSEGQGL